MLDNLLIEFSKHNDNYKQIKFNNYTYELHTFKKDDLLAFASAGEVVFIIGLKEDVYYVPIRTIERNFNTKYKVLGVFSTLSQAYEQIQANKRELLAI